MWWLASKKLVVDTATTATTRCASEVMITSAIYDLAHSTSQSQQKSIYKTQDRAEANIRLEWFRLLDLVR